MKYATERKIIHHGGAYGSLNAQQSIISNRTRTRDALFGPSDDGASNGTNESIYGGLAHIDGLYLRGQEVLLLRNIRC
jgi:hypothetical protein